MNECSCTFSQIHLKHFMKIQEARENKKWWTPTLHTESGIRAQPQVAGPGGKLMGFAVFPAVPATPVLLLPAQPRGAVVITHMKVSPVQRRSSQAL